jgi:hypothetical protein
MPREKDTTQKERIMRSLGVSSEEADEILASDKAIDRGQPQEFDLPPDKVKIGQKYCHTGTRKTPTAYKFDQRKTVKDNPTKEGLIQFLFEALKTEVENLEIANKTKLLTFSMSGENFELNLIQKRKPKS